MADVAEGQRRVMCNAHFDGWSRNLHRTRTTSGSGLVEIKAE
jgi:hypothetical protein